MTSIWTNDGNKVTFNRLFNTSPDYTVPSLFKIGVGTTAPIASDTDMETGVNINGGATKVFLSGYPILDETNLQITIRCFLNSLEANGNNLTEFGIFNNDTSKIMFSRTVHTAITKTDGIEVSYMEKDVMS